MLTRARLAARQDFVLTSFRNDLYRSVGGFLRVYDVLKRGKTLEARGCPARPQLSLSERVSENGFPGGALLL